MRIQLVMIMLISLLTACSGNDVLPKPKAELRLEYPNPIYQTFDFKYFSFETSKLAKVEKINDKKINLSYPSMRAKIYLTYNPVGKNLDTLLRDAEKFTQEHTVKADEIITLDFINDSRKVYGTMNLVTGNAASQIQFHVTDSLKHFIDGSLYFYAEPNYDSIMPAVKYLQNDILAIF